MQRGLNALVVTHESGVASLFEEIARELRIECCLTENTYDIARWLDAGQYQAVVLDFDTVNSAAELLKVVRTSRSNKRAVVFALATEAEQRRKLLREEANFLLRRPLDPIAIRRSLYAAYDMMLGEHRRYFRCTAKLEVLLTMGSGKSTQCATMNVSQGGLSVQTSQPLTPGESLYFALKLPDNFVVRGTGVVIWDDRHGKSGISIQCSGPSMQKRLEAWLDTKLAELAKKKRKSPQTV